MYGEDYCLRGKIIVLEMYCNPFFDWLELMVLMVTHPLPLCQWLGPVLMGATSLITAALVLSPTAACHAPFWSVGLAKPSIVLLDQRHSLKRRLLN